MLTVLFSGVSENWDDDFDEVGGEDVVIPEAIEAVQSHVVGHLCYVKEFAALVEDLKRLRQLGNSTGTRFGPYRQLWEEAEGIIALATLEDEDDSKTKTNGKAKVRPSFDASTFDPPAPATNGNSHHGLNRRKSILPDDDDIFGTPKGFDSPVPKLNPSFARSKSDITPLVSIAKGNQSPSRVSVKRVPSVKEDAAAAVAKKVMDRVNKKACESASVSVSDRKSVASTISGFSDEPESEKKVEFDTSMLGELVVRVQELIGEMEEALEKVKEMPKRHSGVSSRKSIVIAKDQFDIEGRRIGMENAVLSS